ncbi:hypothetical protein F5883DRAFT_622474 [Diaporthe sp. PMI_573]|nr:hypothetical protein F5883DRAFT_622474 [Diaporthaceae sp. PMI_573]
MHETTNQAIMALYGAGLDARRYLAVSYRYVILTQDFNTTCCYLKLEDNNTWSAANKTKECDIANAVVPSQVKALGGFRNMVVVNIALGGAINSEIDTALESILTDEAKALMLLMNAYVVRGFASDC